MTERLHFHFSFYALEKEMATHSSVLAWRIPGMGLHRVRHDWSDLAVAAAMQQIIMEAATVIVIQDLLLSTAVI